MPVKHKIRVEGCPYGLDNEDPILPESQCFTPCDWRINSREYNHCSWVAFSYWNSENNKLISLREMGKMLDMTHESVRTLLEETKGKLPKTEDELEELFGRIEHSSVRRTSKLRKESKRDILAKLLKD